VALGASQHKSALPHLVRCLEDGDDSIVAAGLLALEQVSGTSFADDRTRDEQIKAWQRWHANQQ
jgi:hypothetical protein